MTHIWLPDDETKIQVDVDHSQDNTCTVYQERFTFTLQPIEAPFGFAKGKGEED